MAEGQPPAENAVAAREVEEPPDPERPQEAARVTCMLCRPTAAPRICLSAACTFPAVSAELSRSVAAFQSNAAAAANAMRRPSSIPWADAGPPRVRRAR